MLHPDGRPYDPRELELVRKFEFAPGPAAAGDPVHFYRTSKPYTRW